MKVDQIKFIQFRDKANAYWLGKCQLNVRDNIMSLNEISSNKHSKGHTERDMNDECRICNNIIKNGADLTQQPWNRKIIESDNYVCTPTIGSLKEGYVLTIPKKHTICAGALNVNELENYWNFTKHVSDIIEHEFGKSVIFEHGPSVSNTKVGCGVDHTHMHIVPIDVSLKDYADLNNKAPITWNGISSINELTEIHDSGEDYLFLENPKGDKFVGTSSEIQSQLFRRCISTHLDIPEKFDWNEYNFEENVQKTLTRFPDNSIYSFKDHKRTE